MAIEKEIIIKADTKKADKGLNELYDVLQDIKKQNEVNEKSFKETEKSVKDVGKSTKILAKGFRGAGLALKAMGIGLAIEAFNIIKDLFMSNKKLADLFGTATKALGIVFNDLFGFILENVPKVIDYFKEIFENPTESLKELGEAIKANLIERFVSAIEVVGFLSDALVKVFNRDFTGAMESVKQAGTEFADVMTGVDDSVEKVKDGVVKIADSVAKYAVETYNSADALQEQENAALLAAATQEGLIEKYDRQAEKLRQTRDNETKSIADRIKANKELATVLEEQEKAMKAEAALQVQAAENQFALNGNIENETELIRARNNVKAIEAQVEGFRSEQKINQIGLEKELIDLTKARTQSETELSFKEKQFAVEQIKDDAARLEAKKALIEEERAIDLQQLQDNINLYKEGTEARLDAEIEFNTRKQELDQQVVVTETELEALRQKNREKIADNENKIEQQKIAVKQKTLDDLTSIAGAETKMGQALLIVKQGLALKELLMEAKKTITMGTLAGAKATVATAEGAAQTAKVGFPQNIPLLIGYAAQATGIISSVLSAVKGAKQVASGLGGGGGGSSASGIKPPAFNVVGTSGANQIAEQLGQEQQPIQAYVVGSNVTSQQEMDRNIVDTATLG